MTVAAEQGEGEPRTYTAFWPVYLRAHARPATRGLHYAGTSLALEFVVGTGAPVDASVRVRVEAGSDRPLRALVRSTGDVSRGFESSSTLVDVEEVVALLRSWLQEALDSRTI